MHMQQGVSIQPVRVCNIFYSEELHCDGFSITEIYFVLGWLVGFSLACTKLPPGEFETFSFFFFKSRASSPQTNTVKVIAVSVRLKMNNNMRILYSTF